ncbi:MAG TPA: hypothetical protein DCZ94_07565 [Lentisphaeria bacterium]|nr:MAG: hypothetical protein A2X48_14240 [Lentisphaerae bacterium GWF2_49_21]HBC86794.1 hypothetical protein [Lentisphaeria bacterium]
MKSLTIHGIDPNLDRELKGRARKESLSLNKTIKRLLEDSLGLTRKNVSADHSADFKEFFGKWKKEEADEFLKTVEFSRNIDGEDWK